MVVGPLRSYFGANAFQYHPTHPDCGVKFIHKNAPRGSNFSVTPELPAGVFLHKMSGQISGIPVEDAPLCSYHITATTLAKGTSKICDVIFEISDRIAANFTCMSEEKYLVAIESVGADGMDKTQDKTQQDDARSKKPKRFAPELKTIGEAEETPLNYKIKAGPNGKAAVREGHPVYIELQDAVEGAVYTTSTPLPPGLTLDPKTGCISGTPTTTADGVAIQIQGVKDGETVLSTELCFDIRAKNWSEPTMFLQRPEKSTGAPGKSSGKLGYELRSETLCLQKPVRIEPVNAPPKNVSLFTVEPVLPPGLMIHRHTGVISGNPVVYATKQCYRVLCMTKTLSQCVDLYFGITETPGKPYFFATCAPVEKNLATGRMRGSEKPPMVLAGGFEYFLAEGVGVSVGVFAEFLIEGLPSNVKNFEVDEKLPQGITLNKDTGSIFGVATEPTQSKTYTITCDVGGEKYGSKVYFNVVEAGSKEPAVCLSRQLKATKKRDGFKEVSETSRKLSAGATVAMEEIKAARSDRRANQAEKPSPPGGPSSGAQEAIGQISQANLRSQMFVASTSSMQSKGSYIQHMGSGRSNRSKPGQELGQTRVNSAGFEYMLDDADGIYVGVRVRLSPVGAPGGALYTVQPQLPAGLALNPRSGAIVGKPEKPEERNTYNVFADSHGNVSGSMLNFSVVFEHEPPLCMTRPMAPRGDAPVDALKSNRSNRSNRSPKSNQPRLEDYSDVPFGSKANKRGAGPPTTTSATSGFYGGTKLGLIASSMQQATPKKTQGVVSKRASVVTFSQLKRASKPSATQCEPAGQRVTEKLSQDEVRGASVVTDRLFSDLGIGSGGFIPDEEGCEEDPPDDFLYRVTSGGVLAVGECIEIAPKVWPSGAKLALNNKLPLGLEVDLKTGSIKGRLKQATTPKIYTAVIEVNSKQFSCSMFFNVAAGTGFPYSFFSHVNRGGIPTYQTRVKPNCRSHGFAYKLMGSSAIKKDRPVKLQPAVNAEGANFDCSRDLPQGLSIASATGAIAGIPVVASRRNIYRIIAMRNGGQAAAAELYMAVCAPNGPSIPFTSRKLVLDGFGYVPWDNFEGFVVGRPAVIVPVEWPDGATFSMESLLPPGLRLDSDSGVIYGIPEQERPLGTFRVAARCEKHTWISVIEAAVTTPGVTPEFAVKTVSRQTWTVGDCKGEFTYGSANPNESPKVGVVAVFLPQKVPPGATFAAESNLPEGLSIDSATGVISGIPQQAKKYIISVAAYISSHSLLTADLDVHVR